MWKTSLALLIGIGACHPAMDDMSSMRSLIEDTRSETSRHLAAARGTSSMPDLLAEHDRHRDRLTPMMVDIDIAMENMTSHCDGLGEMRAMHGELDGEMAQHMATMQASAELPVAVAEVERHAATMMSMMDAMHGTMRNMNCR